MVGVPDAEDVPDAECARGAGCEGYEGCVKDAAVVAGAVDAATGSSTGR